MDANTDRMPGDAEAAAAIAGMHDVYGGPLPAVGDWVNGESHGKVWAGRVIDATDTTVVVDLDGAYGQLVAPLSHLKRV